MWRFISSFFLLILLCVLTQRSVAVRYSDTATSPYSESIEELSARGVLVGYDDGSFRPEALVNRAEFLKITLKARGDIDVDAPDTACFRDVKPDAWYAAIVCQSKAEGIVRGYPDGAFHPEQTVNTAEAATIALNALHVDVPAPGFEELWFTPYLAYLKERSILRVLLESPAHAITREEAAELIARLVKEYHASSSSERTSSSSSFSSSASSEETIRHGALAINQETSGVVTTTTAGAKDVPLLRFTALAGRQDVYLTKLVFAPDVGSLRFAESFNLAMDRDGNGSYETIVAVNARVDNASLTFDQFGKNVVLYDGLPVRFEVRATMPSTVSSTSLGIRFATENPAFVEASGVTDGRLLSGIELNGTCAVLAICWIQVNTQTSRQVSVVDRGNLYVESATSYPSRQVLAGAISDPLLSFHLRAEDEDIDIRFIAIDGVTSSIESLLLTKDDDATPFAQTSGGQCAAPLATRSCADLPSRTLVIKKGSETTITVRARIKSDIGGAVSGQSFSLSLSPSTSGPPAITARGITSVLDLDQNDGDSTQEGEIFMGRGNPGPNQTIAGPIEDVVFAKIGAITDATSASQQTTVPTGLQSLGTFRVAGLPNLNSNNNDVIIKTMQFRISAHNVQIDPLSLHLRNEGNPSVYAQCSASSTTGTIDVTCDSLNTSAVDSRVDQGSSNVYILEGNITDASIGPGSSILSVSLPILSDRGSVNSITWGDGVSTFTWVESVQTSVTSKEYRSH